MPHELTLTSRLKSCLNTILELEEALDDTDVGKLMQDEFVVLREVAERLDSVKVNENDVLRIEKATTRFLLELTDTSTGAYLMERKRRVLQ